MTVIGGNEPRRKVQEGHPREHVRCHGSHKKPWSPQGGNVEYCWLVKDSGRVQGALGFGDSMEVIGDTGRIGFSGVGRHWS